MSRRGHAALAGAAALGVLAAGAGPRLARHVRALRAADPGLLSPIAYVPIPMRGATALMRRLPRRPNVFGDGVTGRVRTVPAEGGGSGARVVTYDPVGRRRPSGVLLWLHGGGFVLGDTTMEDAWCSLVARDLGALVVNVDYRLAPEHPFPAALDDGLAALRWLVGRADELGVDRDRIAVGGESAGGGLAAALVQRAHDDELPVCFQLLVYPMLDDRTVLAAEAAGASSVVWTPASNRYGWSSYLGHDAGLADVAPYAVPARRVDLTGLPPAWIGVGSVDLFHAEDLAYARRLRAAGVEVELHEVPGMPHAADRGSRHPAMIEFTRRRLDSLRPHLVRR